MTVSFPFHLTSYWIEFLKLSQHLLLIQRRYMIYEAPKVINQTITQMTDHLYKQPNQRTV